MNLGRWTWSLVWAGCLAGDLVDTYSAALQGTGRLSLYRLDLVLVIGYAVLLVLAIRRAVADVDRSARLAVVRAMVDGQAARGGNA